MGVKMNNIIITGATGFIGNALFNYLTQKNIPNVYATARSVKNLPVENSIQISDISKNTDWSPIFTRKIDTIIHCAARVHIMNDVSTDPIAEFRKVNVDGTLRLAHEAIKNGVRRFIFISSIKVNGEETIVGEPFKSSDKANPSDPYGISKYEAEQALLKLASDTDLEVVIIRPTLVYGPNVKGNFNNLLRLSSSSLPLPFGSINNVRSMIYLDNLLNLITHCIHTDTAKNQIILASDGEDLSLSSLLKTMRRAQNKRPLLIPIPTPFFKFIGRMLNKKAIISRLLGNLQVDTLSDQEKLHWKPPFTAEEGLSYTVQYFINRK